MFAKIQAQPFCTYVRRLALSQSYFTLRKKIALLLSIWPLGDGSQIAQTRQRRNDTPDNYHRSSDMSNSFVIENNICRNS